MRPLRSLRVRLTVAFTGIAGVAVVGAALSMGAVVERSIWEPLEARLGEEAETLAGLWNAGAEHFDVAATMVADEEDVGPGRFIIAALPDGRVRSWGPVPDAFQVPSVARLSEPDRIAADAASATRTGISRTPDGVAVLVGARVDQPTAAVHRAHAMIATGAALLIAALGALAWAVTTSATRELGRLAADLETIEAGSLDRRLSAQTMSEVDRLASVLNRVLERLEVSVAHLRRFSADAAHELRTPIAALRARLEVAVASPRDATAYREQLLDALEQTERLERLAEQLLSLAAVEAERSRPHEDRVVDLASLARDVGDSLEPIAQEQDRRLVVRAPDALPVLGAADLLKRLMVNLVDNALRYSPPATSIELAVERTDGHACIRTHDDGPGIPAAEQARVFERFYRGRESRGGTGAGLGLALCREIALRHRGEIELASAPGAGTTVRVTLPLAPDASRT
jgi:signal transduction histidine kinase